MNNIISVRNLSIGFQNKKTKTEVVKSISFDIPKGKTVALVGESGCGKTVTALSLLKLLPYPSAFHKTGKIIYNKQNILNSKRVSIEKIRGKNISAIFQEPMTSLNPLHTIEKQINEILIIHNKISKNEASKKTFELLKQVGLEKIANRPKAYPHELSGGQRQRVMIAMSIANKPDLLIADEPTTALDVTVQTQILDLMQKIQKEMNMSILFISHDLSLVKKIADYVCIMKDGVIVEKGLKKLIFSKPKHKYTQTLISSKIKKRKIHLNKKNTILKVKNLKVWFPIKKGILRKTVNFVKAVDSISFDLKKKETLGVVGESGSGKTSLVLSILKLINANGDILFDKKNLKNIHNTTMKNLRKEMQIVFQDPFSSLSPRMTIEEIVSEGLDIHEKNLSKKLRKNKIIQILNEVGLNYDDIHNRFPHEFSGGQRQRISIARALILNPKLLILDEPTSALDVTIQNQILELLNNLQEKFNLSYIFISHDMKVIKAMADNIIVLKNGKIIEKGKNKDIFKKPKQKYTKQLLSSLV